MSGRAMTILLLSSSSMLIHNTTQHVLITIMLLLKWWVTVLLASLTQAAGCSLLTSYIQVEEFVFTEYVQPISVVPVNPNPKDNVSVYGDSCVTSGWGYSQHDASGNPIIIPGTVSTVRIS